MFTSPTITLPNTLHNLRKAMAHLLIHGAGGHAKVAYTVAIASQREVIGFLDPHSPLQTLFDLPVFKSNPYRSDS
jgi:hypothetical protein